MTIAQALRMIEISDCISNVNWLRKLFLTLEFATILKGKKAYLWDIKKIPEWIKKMGMEEKSENAKGDLKKAARWLAIKLSVSPIDAEEKIRIGEMSALCYEIIKMELEKMMSNYQAALAAQTGSKDYHKSLEKEIQKITQKLDGIEQKTEQLTEQAEVQQKLSIAQLKQNMFQGILAPV